MKDWFGGFNQVYLPESTIETVGSDRVMLSLGAKQIKQRGQEWAAEPTGVRNYRRV
jgi:hypothetical protein